MLPRTDYTISIQFSHPFFAFQTDRLCDIIHYESSFYHSFTVRRDDLMAEKTKVEYTAEQKEAVLKRVKRGNT